VPLFALLPRYASCDGDESREAFLEAVAEVFGKGMTDVPSKMADCGERLLPQLWPASKIMALELSLPGGGKVPHCGLHGETLKMPSRQGDEDGLGVVMVFESTPKLPDGTTLPIETPVLLTHLNRWDVDFKVAMGAAVANLRARTKAGLEAAKRWEYHPSGCAQSAWGDRFDAARAALLPALVSKRKRPEGAPTEQGGQVVTFATTSCVFATTSKNALGLCFMGDTVHVKIPEDKSLAPLSRTAYRLMKLKEPNPPDHPLTQTAGEGFIWRWFQYSPGGPPLRASGEFSIPIDAGEVEAILGAAEQGKAVPVFKHSDSDANEPKRESFAMKKDAANALFKAGEYLKAIDAYEDALNMKPPPSAAEAAVAYANAAQAMINLATAEKDHEKRLGCAAEALRRANRAVELDPSYVKAHLRCANACDILGEADAAAAFRQRVAAMQKMDTPMSASSSSSTSASAMGFAH